MKRYDFIVGFTTFYPSGFKTRYQHFDDLKVAKMFANNKNLKNNSKIYVDLEYYEELENINKQNIQEIKELKEELNKKPIFLIKDLYNPKLKGISLQDVNGLIKQGREEILDKIKEILNSTIKYATDTASPDLLQVKSELESLLKIN